MFLRRLASLALCASILHLRVAERSAVCVHSDGGHDAHAGMVMDAPGMDMPSMPARAIAHDGMDMNAHAAMQMGGEVTPAEHVTDASHEHVEIVDHDQGADEVPCDAPGPCVSMATCSNPPVNVGQTIVLPVVAESAHSYADTNVVPGFRLSGPEPPPPKA